MYKFVVLAAVLACANAGYLGGYAAAPALATTYAAAPALATTYAAAPVAYGHAAAVPAAITSQSSNILRSYGNLGQVSTYTKTVDTPFSSVRKSDVRVSNPGLATVAHAPVAYGAYAAPAVATYAHAAPAIAAAPVLAARTAYAAPVAHAGLLGVAYSAAPAVSHMAYTNSYGIQYGW